MELRRESPDASCVQANLDIYKKAGEQVVDVLSEFASRVEKRSVDEVAIDVTEEACKVEDVDEGLAASHLADSGDSLTMARITQDATRRGDERQRVRDGSSRAAESSCASLSAYERLLLRGAAVVARARTAVKTRLGFTCSGGVAPNKMMAKLGCGLHKPDQQTVVLPSAFVMLLRDMPLDRLPGLGGDLGKRVMRELRVSSAGDVAALSESSWAAASFDASEREWLQSVCSGNFSEPVKDRASYQSFASSKTFYSKPLDSLEACEPWITSFAAELWKRIEDDRAARRRAPTNVTVSLCFDRHITRTEKISIGWGGSAQLIEQIGNRLLRKWSRSLHSADWRIIVLGLSVSNFIELPNTAPISEFFATVQPALRNGDMASGTGDKVPCNADIIPHTHDAAPSNGDISPCNGEKAHPTRDTGLPCEDALLPNVDRDVFDALPADIQAELKDKRMRRLLLDGSDISCTRHARQHTNSPPISMNKKPKLVKGKSQSNNAGSIRNFFTFNRQL